MYGLIGLHALPSSWFQVSSCSLPSQEIIELIKCAVLLNRLVSDMYSLEPGVRRRDKSLLMVAMFVQGKNQSGSSFPVKLPVVMARLGVVLITMFDQGKSRLSNGVTELMRMTLT